MGKLAILSGADTVEMDHVQVHPTGFVDPADRSAHTKTLCAEILRGVGALLLDRQGLRFANELGRRDYLSDAMLAADPEGKTFTILLNEKAAAEANKHVPLYLKKGLLVEHNSLHDGGGPRRRKGEGYVGRNCGQGALCGRGSHRGHPWQKPSRWERSHGMCSIWAYRRCPDSCSWQGAGIRSRFA